MGKEYIYKIGEVVNESLKIIEFSRVKSGNRTVKGYVVQSLKYQEAPTYKITESSLKSGSRCSYSSTPAKRIFEGNSLYSCKKIRNNIIDINQAKTIAPGSGVKIFFKCENVECDNIKLIAPSTLLKQGYGCSICSKGVSYPELLFNGVNIHFNLKYDTQQVFSDFKEYRFDFVNYETRTIVETHGEQHYKDCGIMNHKKTVKSDIAKREYCKENNWTLIELDCRKSEYNFIIDGVNNCELLPNVTESDKRNILKIIENNRRYPIKNIKKLYSDGVSIKEISEKYNMLYETTRNILKNSGFNTSSKLELPEQKIINLYIDDRLTCRKIADMYKVSQSTIIRTLEQNNIKLRGGGKYGKRKSLPKQEIIDLYNYGFTTYEIANKYSVTTRPISDILKNNKVNTRDKHLDLPTEEIIKLYESGMSANKISKMFSVSRCTITNRLKNSGVIIRHTNF